MRIHQWPRTCTTRCKKTPVCLRIACAFCVLGAVSMPFHAHSRQFAQPGEHLPPQHRAGFERGSTLFQRVFTPATGLGPEFNAVSCASCHRAPVVGGSGGNDSTSFVDWIYTDAADALGEPGQRLSLSLTGSTRPVRSTTHIERRTPPLFGVGQLESIPVQQLLARSDPFDADQDGVSGRLPLRDGCYGRFGWQSTVCDVPSFVTSALTHEIGILVFPRSQREISRSDVADLAAFVRGLGPPPPPPQSRLGDELFERIRCAECHTPVTGVARPGGALIQVRAYTDLLLHEMGNGRRHGEQDSRTEFRTPALWGAAATGPYLHDGSAATLEQAVLRHGGEATESRRLFSGLDAETRLQLLRFLATR